MDQVYEELDDAKAEIESLKADLRGKTDSLENLKKFQNAQVSQIQEAKLKIEKLDQELLQKADEVTEAKQNCEDLKGSLANKESIIKHLNAMNEKIRVDCEEKLMKCEDEKKRLVLALEEATERVENQEQQIHVYRQEIESLKGCLSASKRCLEVKKKSKASEEHRGRDDIFHELEEENRKVAEQLKWKKEQFKHLEEAHEKVREQFRSSKQEWELEKSTLLDEISSLQMKLDSQIRISENLQNQFQMCSQALAHEENRRKLLEVQVSDYKVRFEDFSGEFQLDHFNSQQDSDIGDLRYSLKTKEAECKELKYTIGKLEQENQELRVSLKELREAQIQEAGAAFSQSKLRAKLRNLEQTHRECASTLGAKEAKWKLQLEKLTGDLNGYRSELENKTEAIEELKMELESSQSSAMQLKLLNEEMSLKLLVLTQEISEALLKLAKDKEEMDSIIKERGEKCSELMKQLEMMNINLIRAQKEINEEREEAAQAMRKVDSLDVTKEKQDSMQNELDRYKKMLEESTKCQLLLKDKILQMESYSNEKIREVSDALDRANTELDERIYEGNEIEFELQIWKSIVERLRNDLEENHVIRRELEDSLIAQVDFGETLKQEKDSLIHKLEEDERRIDDLQQQVFLLEQELETRLKEASSIAMGETTMSFETDEYHQIIQKKAVVAQEQESFGRELGSATIASCTGRKYEHERKLGMDRVINQMASLGQQFTTSLVSFSSLGQQFTTSLVSFSSQLGEKQAEVNLIQEACDKITAAEILAIIEIEEKKLMIGELEDDIHDVEQKLKLQEIRWSHSEQLAVEIDAEMEAKQLKMKELTDQIEAKLKGSDALYHKLKVENRCLIENVKKLSSERENLLSFIMQLDEKICEFFTEDTQLMDMLGSIVQPSGMNLKMDDDFLTKENTHMHSPTGTKRVEAISDVRSPFKELNN